VTEPFFLVSYLCSMNQTHFHQLMSMLQSCTEDGKIPTVWTKNMKISSGIAWQSAISRRVACPVYMGVVCSTICGSCVFHYTWVCSTIRESCVFHYTWNLCVSLHVGVVSSTTLGWCVFHYTCVVCVPLYVGGMCSTVRRCVCSTIRAWCVFLYTWVVCVPLYVCGMCSTIRRWYVFHCT